MHNTLLDLTSSHAMEILDSAEVTSADALSPGGCILQLNNNEQIYSDQVWLATGTQSNIESMRCLKQILADVPVIDGLPLVDHSLRLGPHPVYVMGRVAAFALGPAAGNLWGARHAARRITTAITGIELSSDGYYRQSSGPNNTKP